MAKARWHPVSEKLPKLPDNVIVTVINKGHRTVTMAYYDKEHSCWRYAANGKKIDDVVAWIALAPWEG